jgi:hypothetical protein
MDPQNRPEFPPLLKVILWLGMPVALTTYFIFFG